jgi:hypothetical protein
MKIGTSNLNIYIQPIFYLNVCNDIIKRTGSKENLWQFYVSLKDFLEEFCEKENQKEATRY